MFFYDSSSTSISRRIVTNSSLFTLSSPGSTLLDVTRLRMGNYPDLNFSSLPPIIFQTEVVNQTVEMYLCCFVGDFPRRWVAWVSWAEYYYNISFHSALRTTPFQVVYGRPPPKLLSSTTSSTRVDVVDGTLINRDKALEDIQWCLLQAQQRMKDIYHKSHRDIEFSPRDRVWLCLHPYRQHSAHLVVHTKLSPHFVGPFSVVRGLGQVAYELNLTLGSCIHNVFYVSLLKTFMGDQPPPITYLSPIEDGKVVPTSNTVIRAIVNRGTRELLVQWKELPEHRCHLGKHWSISTDLSFLRAWGQVLSARRE